VHSPEETIAALSTPPGRGGIAVIRLTGPAALDCSTRLFKMRANDRIEPAKARLGWICAASGERIDRGYLTWHPAGRSFTGEDLVELSCHSSPVVIRQVLEELSGCGARAAEPGEFTYRAVLHGRLDLAQAEGVRDLIHALTPEAARVALRHMRGDLSRSTAVMSEGLVEIISRLEARLEFAEEPDVLGQAPLDRTELSRLLEQVNRFADSYRRGRLLRDGARVVLAGRPNSGKSSLFNRLLSIDRAIVSHEAGTTRDVISECLDMGGIPVTLVDTAGMRDDARGVEAEGVARARRMIGEADLILALCACDELPDAVDAALLEAGAGRVILVASKADLMRADAPAWTAGSLRVSALTGAGLPDLTAAIVERLQDAGGGREDGILITEARHHEALTSSARRLCAALAAIDAGASEEMVLVDLYAALNHLGEITGAAGLEQVHDKIFSTFCIGK